MRLSPFLGSASKSLLIRLKRLNQPKVRSTTQRFGRSTKLCRYPGNRVLVTSRPVGYDLAPCPEPQFARARVQQFNDQQIEQFLDNWYHHVLKLPSLSQSDQKEKTELSDTLKTNLRLHKLAENPLLLTVITALHRYERLPDKRVRVYDRCAELLLDTWARLRGTDGRWRDMKLDKDQQYACVAYLGFMLHERAQQRYKPDIERNPTQEDGDNDVSQASLLQMIEDFLAERGVNMDSAERHREAKRFCDLMLEEAGLIVERGTGTDGELLYGFIHRTFQEYFAAFWIYDQFQDNVSLSVIEDFLQKHLHDPHWHEVTLLLLGKLNAKPVTTILRKGLDKEIESPGSLHDGILRQTLFFVGSCLVEEIVVQQELAQRVITGLVNLAAQSPFTSQRNQAIDLLDSLVGTQQYGGVALAGLRELARQTQKLPTSMVIRVALVFCTNDMVQQEEQQLADLLEEMVQRPGLVNAISFITAQGEAGQIKKRYRVVRLLARLIHRLQLSIELRLKLTQWLYDFSPVASQERLMAFQALMASAQRSDTSAQQALQTLLNLYRGTTDDETRQQLMPLLIELTQRPDLPPIDIVAEIEKIYRLKRRPPIEQLVRSMVDSFARRPNLPVETLLNSALRVSQFDRLHATSISYQELERFYRPDLPIKEIEEFILRLWLDTELRLEYRMLKSYMQRTDIPSAQAFQVAQNYYESHQEEDTEELAATLLIFYALYSDVTPEQTFQALQTLLPHRIGRNTDTLLTFLLLQVIKRSDMSVEYASKIAHIPSKPNSLISRRPLDQIRQAAIKQWLRSYAEVADYSAEQALHLAEALLQYNRERWAKDKAWQLLAGTSRDKKLSLEQRKSALMVLLHYVSIWSWTELAQLVQMVFALQAEQEAREVLNRNLERPKTASVQDIRALVELSRQELLPPRMRDQIYRELQDLIPRFHELDNAQAIQQERSLSGKERG